MYWKEIPVHVQAEDGNGTASRPLDERFQQAADALATVDGSVGTDAYLNAWEWGDQFEVAGAAADVVAGVADRYNRGFPKNFVAKIMDLRQSGARDPRPGAIDSWLVDCDV